MKIEAGQTGIFDLELKQKLFRELEPRLQELDRTKIYDISLFFDESSIHDSEKIKEFPLPEDKRPERFQKMAMSEKDKLYEILSCQLSATGDLLEEQGLMLNGCSIIGVYLEDTKSVELELKCKDRPVPDWDVGKRGRKGQKTQQEKPMKIYSIMPSLAGFGRNLMELAKRRREGLVRAFGSETLLSQYEEFLGPERLLAIYEEFRKEYGDISFELASDTPALRKRFLAWVKEEARKEEAGKERDGRKEAGREETGKQEVGKAGIRKGGSGKEEAGKAGIRKEGAESEREDGTGTGAGAGRGTAGDTEKPLASLCTFPVYKRKKSGERGKQRAGQIELVTDGNLVKIHCLLTGRQQIPDLEFSDLICCGKDARGNGELLTMLKKLTEKANTRLTEAGLILDDSAISQVLSFMDLKGALRKIRRDQVLSEESR
ncbi:MAG TPA: hypothetical protein IAB28_01950 [Candidatus Copromonas faecavium]|uniref:Uncharacterized protein n=1 Tax=Candidatus Copromonas faecavium (nom. illeg.) TaxID=2840740 RepID=A0A9D1A2R9_9FIRM|nr:hypothetical protein [Candidatus Copromonas faecavium]